MEPVDKYHVERTFYIDVTFKINVGETGKVTRRGMGKLGRIWIKLKIWVNRDALDSLNKVKSFALMDPNFEVARRIYLLQKDIQQIVSLHLAP